MSPETNATKDDRSPSLNDKLQAMTFIELVGSVIDGLKSGAVPPSPHVPRLTEESVILQGWFRTKRITQRRATNGVWAGFAILLPEPFDVDVYPTFYLSSEGDFAVAQFHPYRVVMRPVSTLQVLCNEQTWREGLTALLSPSTAAHDLTINPL